MEKVIRVYETILYKITNIVGAIAGVLLFIPALTICYEVVMRGVFNAPTEWSIETSVYCVLVAGFLGMAVTYSSGKHIKVDILLMHLAKPTRVKLELISSIIGAIFCFVFFYEGLDMVLLSLEIDRRSPDTLRMPLWIPQMSIPIGIGLLFLHFLDTIFRDIQLISSGEYYGGESK